MDALSEGVFVSRGHGNSLLNKSTRVRKVSVDYQGNLKDIDMNGNIPLRRRMSSCSENPVQIPHLQSVLLDVIAKSRESASSDARASGAWENTFLEQIQSLIENVKVSDTLSDCINEEVLENNNLHNHTAGRTRRKSCFAVNRTVSYKNAQLNGRRMSVTEREPTLSQSGPRRKVSTAGLENINNLHHESVTFNSGRRCSVTSQGGGRRNSVVVNPVGRRNSVVNGNGRRNSVVTGGRRSSVAHIPGYGSTPAFRRLSSIDNVMENQMNIPQQRRRSSVVQPACFNVSKISNLQRRLHRIYRQRRRKNRAHVDIQDVRTAMGVDTGEKSDTSTESDSDKTVPADGHESDSAIANTTDAENNSYNEQTDDLNGTSDCLGENLVTDDNLVTEVSDHKREISSNDNEQELIPNPRRKTSIQVRSWEISRQLRQRRREKRKSGKESDLI